MNHRPPIKVVYCEHNLDGTVGGSYYSLLYLVSNLSRNRFSPTVVFYSDHGLISAFRSAGVETLIWRQAMPFTFGSRLRDRNRWLGLPLLLLQKAVNVGWTFIMPALTKAWFLWRNNFQIVHLNNGVLYNHDWMLAAQLTRRRCVTHERGIYHSYSAVAKYFAKRLDAVICISAAVRKQLHECGVDFGNLVTIHNGLDPAALKFDTSPVALRQQYGVPEDAVVVGMLGNILWWKGQDTLIRAIAEVRRRRPYVWCLFVGDVAPSDRPYESSLRELIDRLNLKDRIVFTGFQKNVADFLRMFDIAVHASISPEPFGRVVLEAMACRKPFIGSHAGAIPELVEEGRTGLTFAPGDANALARAIEQLIADPIEAGRMGERAYERLVSQFHITRNTEATERLYEQIIVADSGR